MMTLIEVMAGLLILALVALTIYKVKKVVSPPDNFPKKDETGRIMIGAIPLDPTRKQCLLPEEWDEALQKKE